MKISRCIIFVILSLFLLIVIINVIGGNDVVLFDSINFLSNGEMTAEENNADISDIAHEIGNRIESSAISDVALNIERVEVFDGLTMEELIAKLNKSLKGVLANQGNLVASKCIELGIDPYLAVAIMLHETGCSYSCSSLARTNYNVGGMKGPSGSYQKFSSIEVGITAFLNNLYGNYYKNGLTTPEKIGTKYASSTTWATKINSYMKKIAAK